LFWVWLAAFVTAGLLFPILFVWERFDSSFWTWLPGRISPEENRWAFLGIWLPILTLTFFVRRWLIEYVGDVAAYVSPHKLDRFNDIRAEIQGEITTVLHAIYESSENYDKVIVMGHSLGSVVAYDALNTILAKAEITGGHNKIIDKTKGFITFGTPLNKVAFLFARRGDAKSDIRGRLAEVRQPLIHDKYYNTFRKIPWINVFAKRDIIGAKLTFFDRLNPLAPHTRKVQNVVDKDALIPIMAHNEFWDNPTLFEKLLEAIIKP
jgi:pimeloyl-ACP methyl ester carboxylesterase